MPEFRCRGILERPTRLSLHVAGCCGVIGVPCRGSPSEAHRGRGPETRGRGRGKGGQAKPISSPRSRCGLGHREGRVRCVRAPGCPPGAAQCPFPPRSAQMGTFGHPRAFPPPQIALVCPCLLLPNVRHATRRNADTSRNSPLKAPTQRRSTPGRLSWDACSPGGRMCATRLSRAVASQRRAELGTRGARQADRLRHSRRGAGG
jgi:hypothetical protein